MIDGKTADAFLKVSILDLRDGDGNPLFIENESFVAVRGPQSESRGGVKLPQVLWRQSDFEADEVIDGPGTPYIIYYSVECRAETYDAAKNISEKVLSSLRARLGVVLAHYALPDDPDAKRGNYVAWISEIGIYD